MLLRCRLVHLPFRLIFLVKNQQPPRPIRPSSAWIPDLFKPTSQYQVRHSYSHVIVHVYTCFHDHAYYPFSSSAIANPSSPRTLPSPSCLYIASLSPYHAHPHDRLLRLGGIPHASGQSSAYHSGPSLYSRSLSVCIVLHCTDHCSCSEQHTFAPSFPFLLQHLSWLSNSMHCSPIRSP